MRNTTLAGWLLALLLASPSAITATSPGDQVEATLTDLDISTMIFFREDTKMARDLYVTLENTYGARVFANLADSEQRHMNAMLNLLENWDVPDPVTDDAVGAFSDGWMEARYLILLERAEASLLEAFQVGAQVEEMDIRLFRDAIAGTDQPDLVNVYGHLLDASTTHLRAFVSHIEALGVDYVAQVLEQDDLDTLVAQARLLTEMADGGWYLVDRPNEGMVFDVAEDGSLVMAWLTFGPEGMPHWLVGAAQPEPGDSITINLVYYYKTLPVSRYDPEVVTEQPWGVATVTFQDCAHATVSFQLLDAPIELSLERLYYTGGSTCDLD